MQIEKDMKTQENCSLLVKSPRALWLRQENHNKILEIISREKPI